jgi:hypothetical protein
MRQRTFITGSQKRFLIQFGMRFGELTNLREIAGRNNRWPVVLIDPQGWKDGRKYGVLVLKKWGPEVDRADVVLSTYQQLLDTEKGRERFKRYVRDKFGKVGVDETHQAAAPMLSRVVNRTNARYKLGLTATLKRKDNLHPVVSAILGRTAAIGKVTSTLPTIELWETGVVAHRNYKHWAHMEKFLTSHPERNRMIVRQVFKDLRASDKHYILIPVTRVAQNHELVKMINAQAEFNRANKGENWPRELAVSYRGGQDINAILNRVNAGQIRVVVATMSMVKYGIDVQRWTHVYIGATPTSNAPNVYQALNRVCTPYSDRLRKELGEKPKPVVRIMLDEVPASVFCFAKLYRDPDYGLAGAFSGRNYYNVVLARTDPKTAKRMQEIAAYPKSYAASDAGVDRVGSKTRTGRDKKRTIWKPQRRVTKF